jgi:hypothetical protein
LSLIRFSFWPNKQPCQRLGLRARSVGSNLELGHPSSYPSQFTISIM